MAGFRHGNGRQLSRTKTQQFNARLAGKSINAGDVTNREILCRCRRVAGGKTGPAESRLYTGIIVFTARYWRSTGLKSTGHRP